jgi:dolichol kinase
MALNEIDFRTIIAFSAIFFLLFIIAEIAYRLLQIKVDYTRKFVHIMTGVIVMFFPIYFKKPIDLIIICISFFVVLALSKRIGMMPSINAIDRKSKGSTLYPVVVIICYLVQYWLDKYIYFFVPILILALADPAAEFAGKKFKYRPYSIFGNDKTISGSLGFLLVAAITAAGGLYFFSEAGLVILIFCTLSIAIISTFGEAVSVAGYDNLVIPLSAVGVLYMFGI